MTIGATVDQPGRFSGTRIGPKEYQHGLTDDDTSEQLRAWIEDVIGQDLAAARITWAELGEGQLVCEHLALDDDGAPKVDRARAEYVTCTTTYRAPVPPPVWPRPAD